MSVRLAPFLFVMLWSSSFITGKIGLQHLTPLLFVAIRLVSCAIILTVVMLVLRRSWKPLAGWQWLHCAVAGALLNAMGLMAPQSGSLIAPAAHIALVQSLTSLLTAGLGVLLLHERLRAAQWLGLALGLVGVGLVVGERRWKAPPVFRASCWPSSGCRSGVRDALFRPVLPRHASVAGRDRAISVGGGRLLARGVLFETPQVDWTEATIAAATWNTLMVSLGGMGLYSAMLVRGSVARTSANFYLVPGTVAVLAWATARRTTEPAGDRRVGRSISRMLAGQRSTGDADRGCAPIGCISTRFRRAVRQTGFDSQPTQQTGVAVTLGVFGGQQQIADEDGIRTGQESTAPAARRSCIDAPRTAARHSAAS